MFSYYGGKGRSAHKYPVPKYDLVIEPFCGAAWYSVRHQLGKRALLFDVDPVIASIWEWLITSATEDEIMELPPYTPGSLMETGDWGPGKSAFYRFWGNRGSERPRNVAGSWCKSNFTVDAKRVGGVKSWKFSAASYESAPDVPATWFIDPPYCQQHRYRHNDINYTRLADWCMSRRGQVIVCESRGADWLPFDDFIMAPSQRPGSKYRQEVIFYRETR